MALVNELAILPVSVPSSKLPRLDPGDTGGRPYNRFMAHPTLARITVRVDVEHRPGAPTLIGRPGTSGLAWAAGFGSRAAVVVALLRRALAIDEDSGADC